MPNSPSTRLVIFNIFWRSPCQVLRSAHHSSGGTGTTSSPLDHFSVSLSKQTDIVHAEGCQLDSCDIVRYTDQCCIGLKLQSESFTIEDLLMLPVSLRSDFTKELSVIHKTCRLSNQRTIIKQTTPPYRSSFSSIIKWAITS